MSAPIKTKEELTRLAWLVELRRQGHRQCLGAVDGMGGVCAMVLLGEVATGGRSFAVHSCAALEDIGSKAGLHVGQVVEVVEMNDGCINRDIPPHTFSEIADVVEGWFSRE